MAVVTGTMSYVDTLVLDARTWTVVLAVVATVVVSWRVSDDTRTFDDLPRGGWRFSIATWVGWAPVCRA